jgi:hypothetical protein
MATERMDQQWFAIRDRIRTTYGNADLTTSELRRARGNLGRMVDLIHEKTGKPRADIRATVMALI